MGPQRGVVAHPFNPSNQEAGAGRVQGQSGLHSEFPRQTELHKETLSQNKDLKLF